MDLAQSLAHVADTFEPRVFGALREQLDPEWIMQALEDSGTVTVRRRRLPAEEMIWLVIGMALFRDRSIVEVADKLHIGRSSTLPTIAPSALHQARERLKAEPMQWLFSHSAKAWGHKSASVDRFHDLALYGLDGTSLRVQDSPQNAAHFGYTSGGERGESAYPQARLVALMALRSHLIVAAAFGPNRPGEYSYAAELWTELPANSLVVFDRNFYSAQLLLSLRNESTNKHWLMRIKDAAQMRVVEQLGADDALVELTVSKEARRKDPSLPRTYVARCIRYQRPGFEPKRLLTSLLDAKRYSAEQISALYHERWEIELAYDEIKTELLERRECIRSKTPQGTMQEIWGILLAYNLVRFYMERVAIIAKVPPVRISFVAALRLIRDEWDWDSMPRVSVGAIPRHLQELTARMSRFILPERRDRSYPRAVKIKMSAYLRKRRAPGLN